MIILKNNTKMTFSISLIFGMILFFTACQTAQPSFSPVDEVNPLMGSFSTVELSHGNTYPAIAEPWGMNFWTPQTGKMGDGWIYSYSATHINGFKQTHQPSPWMNDYGQFALMPVSKTPVFEESKRASWFSHKTEITTPYYYGVYLADHHIFAEMTPTTRAAIFRFTYPEGKSYLVIDALDQDSMIKILPEQNRIIGYSTKNSGGVPKNFKNYFIIQFSHAFSYQQTFKNQVLFSELSQIGDHTGAVIGFDFEKSKTIEVKVASSFISFEQAEWNLKEVENKTFDQVKEETKNKWNHVLSRIQIEGGSNRQRRTFYSCLYRTLLFPRKFYEISPAGEIIHYSPFNGQVLPGYLYTDTGFWDTFRALFPFLNLMYPSVNQEIQKGLLNAYKESGFLPEWASPGHRGCMIGNNSASVIADAYLKGIHIEEIQSLYHGIWNGTQHVHPEISSAGRLGYSEYNQLGYIPSDIGIHESVARTLEYAYSDWCILQLAKALNRPQEEIEILQKRAQNYQHVFDAQIGLMRGRKKNGAWQTPFNPLKWGDSFTEGNSWHYTWSVFHDIQGLIDLMGGDENFIQKLDTVLSMPPTFDESYYGYVIHEIREMQIAGMGNYAHGNQPIQHMLYLYNYAGQPWKTQYWVREVMDKLYTPDPDGYCGDEDNGQTSAWYIFSALGFYPVCPGSLQYVIGSPLFSKVILNFENGKKMEICASENSSQNRYISQLLMNGSAISHNFFTHQQLLKGGNIHFFMQSSPNFQRGIKDSDRPFSFTNK